MFCKIYLPSNCGICTLKVSIKITVITTYFRFFSQWWPICVFYVLFFSHSNLYTSKCLHMVLRVLSYRLALSFLFIYLLFKKIVATDLLNSKKVMQVSDQSFNRCSSIFMNIPEKNRI